MCITRTDTEHAHHFIFLQALKNRSENLVNVLPELYNSSSGIKVTGQKPVGRLFSSVSSDFSKGPVRLTKYAAQFAAYLEHLKK